jgi:N-acyl homoserine lactone hydrolase
MAGMTLTITRLHLATLRAPDGDGRWPVHGFVVTHPGGVVLVDTGVGGPDAALSDWRVVNTQAARALADIGLAPSDISLVINTHLHFDHCGQNAVFAHAPFYVQRAELDRARRESAELADWFDFAGARFELLDGDAGIVPGLSVLATPGHTAGHQSVLVRGADGVTDVLIGDAAYTPRQFALAAAPSPGPAPDLPPGQAADPAAWRDSLGRIRAAGPVRVHFCHHPDVLSA